MKALIVGSLALLTLLAVAPVSDAQPPLCSYSIGTHSGYVACHPPGTGGCVSVSYGGTYYCVPR